MEIVEVIVAVMLAMVFGWTLGKTIVISKEIEEIEDEIDELRRK